VFSVGLSVAVRKTVVSSVAGTALHGHHCVCVCVVGLLVSDDESEYGALVVAITDREKIEMLREKQRRAICPPQNPQMAFPNIEPGPLR
jgi:hypothetical protein